MQWLVLSYFLSLGTLSYQAEFINPPIEAFYLTPKGTFVETFGVELQVADIAFVGGSVQTWETTGGAAGMFSPTQSLYVFNVGVRKNGLEMGWRWECDHMTLAGTLISDQGFLSNKSEIYLSYRSKITLF